MQNVQASLVVGIDLGGSNTRVCLEDEVIKLPTPDTLQAVHEMLNQTIPILAKGRQLDGIGFAIAGQIDFKRQHIVRAGQLNFLRHWPLAETLERAFGCRCVLGNDVEAMAAYLSQNYAGDLSVVAISTGIGYCRVIRRHGKTVLLPGELGHVYHGTSAICGCGAVGHLDAFGGAGLERRTGRPAANLTAEEWQEVGDVISQHLYNVQTIAPSDAFVLYGGMIANQRWMVERIQQQLTPEIPVFLHQEDDGYKGAVALLSVL